MRFESGSYFIEFEGEPGQGTTATSNLHEAIEENDDASAFLVHGIESAMLALYDAGIFKYANLTRVRMAFETMIDALTNNV
jgi:hypothetical protein